MRLAKWMARLASRGVKPNDSLPDVLRNIVEIAYSSSHSTDVDNVKLTDDIKDRLVLEGFKLTPCDGSYPQTTISWEHLKLRR